MAEAKLSHLRQDFDRRILLSMKLVSDVETLPIHRRQIEAVAEAAFLRMFMSWEGFLEESFLRYLIGAKAPCGYCPRRLVSVTKIETARSLVCANRTVGYVRWNVAAEVRNRAKTYFIDGEPYWGALASTTSEINEMNIVRNRITHDSHIAQERFGELITDAYGYRIKGMTPGRFLLSPMKGLSKSMRNLNRYATILQGASARIIN